MPTYQVTITGGRFQDARGNALANGYLIIKPSFDAMVNGSQITAGATLKIPLGSTGNINGSFELWVTDLAQPKFYYVVYAYSSEGQLVWGPYQQTLLSTGANPFNVVAWLPITNNNGN